MDKTKGECLFPLTISPFWGILIGRLALRGAYSAFTNGTAQNGQSGPPREKGDIFRRPEGKRVYFYFENGSLNGFPSKKQPQLKSNPNLRATPEFDFCPIRAAPV